MATVTQSWTVTSSEPLLESANEIAENLHRISASEEAILERPASFYLSQILNRRIILALEGSEIIGSVSLFPISSRTAEVSGAWVRSDCRWRGVYHTMRAELRKLAESGGYGLIATVKPAIPGNLGEVVVETEFGLPPAPFSELRRLDAEAYENCCCCDGIPGSPHCELRDVQCFLLLQWATGQAVDTILDSDAWTKNVAPSANRKITALLR